MEPDSHTNFGKQETFSHIEFILHCQQK